MRTTHTILCIGILLSIAGSVRGQSLKSFERAGDDAFKNKDFGAAIQYYATVLEKNTADLAILWKYAESARLIYAYGEAEKSYLKIAENNKATKKYPLLKLRLAEIKQGKGAYEEAIEYFQEFLAAHHTADTSLIHLAENGIAHAQIALQLAGRLQNVEIKHLGKEVNSPFSEFAPYLVGDSLFYSSYRFDQKKDRHTPKSKITKVLLSVKGARSREPGRGFPSTDTAHIAHTAFSPDGHFVFFTVCKNKNASDIRCELWLTVIDRRNRWLAPVRLPAPINLPGYTSTQPNIGYDKKAQGPVLWFVSDRPGGKGKTDLWYVPLDTVFFCPCALPVPGKPISKLTKFDNPINAAAINTPAQEGTPFYYAPTQTLYFASDGWAGMGGYDLFAAAKKGDSLAIPQNLGPGFNTSYNDLYLFMESSGRKGYFSSNRPGSYYLDERNKFCCNDLYSFTLLDTNTTTVKKNLPTDSLSNRKHAPNFEVKPNPVAIPSIVLLPSLKTFVGLPLYFDNDEPDKRTNRAFTKRTYEETVLPYLERQMEYREKFTAGISENGIEVAENLVDDFFEQEVRRGYERFLQMSEILLERLEKGNTIEVFIKGFTSPRARNDYNLNLGKRRISSVKNQFWVMQEGKLKPYLQSEKLKITETSFGETLVRSGISDNLQDERNSIYHPAAARERRVEIIEIEEKE
ncbi:MAG: hypothetical protein ACOYPR_15455 [Saprospiraceae bacterium]